MIDGMLHSFLVLGLMGGAYATGCAILSLASWIAGLVTGRCVGHAKTIRAVADADGRPDDNAGGME